MTLFQQQLQHSPSFRAYSWRRTSVVRCVFLFFVAWIVMYATLLWPMHQRLLTETNALSYDVVTNPTGMVAAVDNIIMPYLSLIHTDLGNLRTPRDTGSDTTTMTTTTTVAPKGVFKAERSSNDNNRRQKQQQEDLLLHMAWLMSFPNSGTSYTTRLIRHVSATHSGTNYGHDNLGPNGTSMPIFPNQQPMGPFWTDPTVHPEYRFPTRFVLVKTHCGGRCLNCPTARYAETLYSFRDKCRWTQRAVRHANGTASVEEGLYPLHLLRKAIHLIRNPFDNVVSRFHLDVLQQQQQAKNNSAQNNTTSSVGSSSVASWDDDEARRAFRRHCTALNLRNHVDEQASTLFHKALLEQTAHVPCKADFFKYVEWHNQALVLTRDLQLGTMILHYEDYANANITALSDQLLDFLELPPRRGTPAPFVSGKTYRHYFTRDERRAVRHAMQSMALQETWKHVQHYFEQHVQEDEDDNKDIGVVQQQGDQDLIW